MVGTMDTWLMYNLTGGAHGESPTSPIPRNMHGMPPEQLEVTYCDVTRITAMMRHLSVMSSPCHS